MDQVSGKAGSKKGTSIRSRGDQNNRLTSFFFSNFPDNFGVEEMWKVFLRWGRVWDVYILPRRDKYGRRFGFVKFLDVQNPKVLENELVVILIGNQRLKVNIPRFDRNYNGAVSGGMHGKSVVSRGDFKEWGLIC